jgi:hypothetical protein
MGVSASSGCGRILAYNAGVRGSNPLPPTPRRGRSKGVFMIRDEPGHQFCLRRVPHLFHKPTENRAYSVTARTQ